MNKLICEGGVTYSVTPNETMMPVHYWCCYIPEHHVIKRTVYLYKFTDIYRLLNYWNSLSNDEYGYGRSWKYYII